MQEDTRMLADKMNNLMMHMGLWTKEHFNEITARREDFKFTFPQYKTLLMLRRMQPCKMGDISCETKVSHASLTSMVDRLEEEGAVERVFSKEDRRVVLLKLTKAGEEYLHSVEEAIIASLDMKLQSLTQEKRETIEVAIRYLNEVF